MQFGYSSTVQKPRSAIKRPRKSTICKTCATRRVKCDREKPCGNCKLRGHLCVYPFETAPAASSSSADGPSTAAGAAAPDISASSAPSIDPTIGSSSLPSAVDADVDISSSAPQQPSSTFWPPFFNDNNIDPIDSVTAAFAVADLDPTAARLQRARLISQNLPPRSECDSLVTDFFDWVYPICALMSRTRLWEIYHEFWTSGDTDNSSNFIIIFAILYGASVSRNSKLKFSAARHGKILPDDPCRVQVARFQAATESALRIVDFQARPTLMGLVAATMFQICRRSQTVADASASVSTLLRIAQTMGLHRDPSMFRSNRISVEDAELRRRVWWHLVYLDGVLSTGNGLPVSVQRSAYDVVFVSYDSDNMLDEDKLLIMLGNCLAYNSHVLAPQFADILGARGFTFEAIKTLGTSLMSVKAFYADTIRKINALTFDTHSPYIIPEKLFHLRELCITIMSLSCEKGFLIAYHVNFELRRRKLGAFGLDSGDYTLPLLDTEPDANELHRREHFGRVALRSMKLYLRLIKDPFRSCYSWYLASLPQFHAMIVVLRDICAAPARGLVVPEESLLIDANGQSLTEPSPDNMNMRGKVTDDERLAVVEEIRQVTEFQRLHEASPYIRVQWVKTLRLLEVARQAKFLAVQTSPKLTSVDGVSPSVPSMGNPQTGDVSAVSPASTAMSSNEPSTLSIDGAPSGSSFVPQAVHATLSDADISSLLLLNTEKGLASFLGNLADDKQMADSGAVFPDSGGSGQNYTTTAQIDPSPLFNPMVYHNSNLPNPFNAAAETVTGGVERGMAMAGGAALGTAETGAAGEGGPTNQQHWVPSGFDIDWSLYSHPTS
ncbi:hypothetical protein BZA70DRAFT_298021 [Myxozyma melibiosi]|uniref:Zn(2)-C6 fungal-type domain-containing protein n=1 Tax=Myxozyma melibiosi TaxID=54550 RepID=A0ABR1EXS7_9ASCO